MTRKHITTNIGAITTILLIVTIMRFTLFVVFSDKVLSVIILALLFILYAFLSIGYLNKNPRLSIVSLLSGGVLTALTLNFCLSLLNISLSDTGFYYPIALIYLILFFIMVSSILTKNHRILRKILLCLFILIAITTTIGFIVMYSNEPTGDNLLGIYLTSFLYFYAIKHFRPFNKMSQLSTMAVSMLFFLGVACFIVIICLSEGEALEGIGEFCAEISISGRKKKP